MDLALDPLENFYGILQGLLGSGPREWHRKMKQVRLFRWISFLGQIEVS